MKKRYGAALVAGAAAGAWWICRDKKYPLRPGLRMLNKLVVPGGLLGVGSALLANRLLENMPVPAPPYGVSCERRSFRAGDGERIPLTLYRPVDRQGPLPCLVYLHGGGFCMGDAGYIHRYAVRYAGEAGCMVVFVHYRTSDIAPFPVPFQDCYDALLWTWEHGEELGLDRERMSVGGDSAGGALAAACALRARDEGGPRLCFQLLIYPVTDSRMETPSMGKYTDSPAWNAGLNRRMWEIYLRDGDHGMPAYAAPMLAHDFSGLPPAYVEVEEFDCLHDEGVAYAQALEAAGVPVRLEDVKGTCHGFDTLTELEISRTMAGKRAQALKGAFEGAGQGPKDGNGY